MISPRWLYLVALLVIPGAFLDGSVG